MSPTPLLTAATGIRQLGLVGVCASVAALQARLQMTTAVHGANRWIEKVFMGALGFLSMVGHEARKNQCYVGRPAGRNARGCAACPIRRHRKPKVVAPAE